MKTVQKLKYLIVFYLGSLVFLLLAVIAVPLAIQHGVTINSAFIIEEDILITAIVNQIEIYFLLHYSGSCTRCGGLIPKLNDKLGYDFLHNLSRTATDG
jgi:hypothetical protein